MTKYVETHRAIVAPWQCDQVGHLNMQFYAAAFSDSMFAMSARVGLGERGRQAQRMALPVVDFRLRFKREVFSGCAYYTEAVVTEVGARKILTHHRMIDAETGDVLAEADFVCVSMDMDKHETRPLPNDIAVAAKEFMKNGAAGAT